MDRELARLVPVRNRLLDQSRVGAVSGEHLWLEIAGRRDDVVLATVAALRRPAAALAAWLADRCGPHKPAPSELGAPTHPAADAAELIAHCRESLASFKVPRQVRFVTEWPMSATKIQKQRLLALLERIAGRDLFPARVGLGTARYALLRGTDDALLAEFFAESGEPRLAKHFFPIRIGDILNQLVELLNDVDAVLDNLFIRTHVAQFSFADRHFGAFDLLFEFQLCRT